MRRRFFLTLAVAAVGSPGASQAHLVSTELGPFYDGAAHSLVSPLDLMTILGMAILGSFAGVGAARRLVVGLTAAWGTGTVVGFAIFAEPWDLPVVVAVATLLLGIAAAVKLKVPPGGLLPLAIAAGLTRGLMNGSAARAADGSWLSVTGIVVGVLALVLLLSGLGAWLVRRRYDVALRIAGSWVAAISLLTIGWRLRG